MNLHLNIKGRFFKFTYHILFFFPGQIKMAMILLKWPCDLYYVYTVYRFFTNGQPFSRLSFELHIFACMTISSWLFYVCQFWDTKFLTAKPVQYQARLDQNTGIFAVVYSKKLYYCKKRWNTKLKEQYISIYKSSNNIIKIQMCKPHNTPPAAASAADNFTQIVQAIDCFRSLFTPSSI